MKMEIQHTEIYGLQQNSSKREFYSDKQVPLEKRKISNNPTLPLNKL